MTFRVFRTAALALIALALAAGSALAFDESDLLPVDEAFALDARAVDDSRARFSFTIANGYYLYRHRFSVQALDEGLPAGTLDIPHGTPHHDEFFGDVETWRGQVAAELAGLEGSLSSARRFRLKYQGCANAGICYPPQVREVTIQPAAATTSQVPALGALPGAAPSPGPAPGGLAILGQPASGQVALGSDTVPLPEEQAFGFEAIANSPTELLLRFTPAPGYYLYRDRSEFRLLDADGVQLASPRWPQGQQHQDEHFGEVIVYFDQIELPLGLRRSRGEAGPITLEATFQGCQNDGICYPPMTRQVALELPAAAPDQLVSLADPARETAAPVDAGGWLRALLLALGGGLILNLMPCVLPVLSLKALSLAQSGESPGKARAHALWYTAGVLASFALLGAAALALRQLGLALGWGFQLQQPLVVGALAYLMAAIGLSLSGVFSIGAGWAGAGQSLASKSGPAGDFFTGVLAVVVASPCTAPLMGGALAFAFVAPTAVAISVFLALGLGLALPFLAIGFVPALARRLPRPGAWMEALKQALAFPMYLTAVWLLWVLGQQRGVDALGYALAGIVVLALALWRWEKARWSGSFAGRALALALALLAIWPLWRIPQLAIPEAAAESDAGAQAYSAKALDTLRADGRTVFVNMTADWCVTCKANEKRVLDTDAFRQTLAAHEAVYMKGDWTRVDPAITAFLESHGAVGVPLYVVIRPGHEDAVLPTVLTFDAVESALGAP